MATWADIQSWDHNAIIEAEDLIEAEVRETREIIADLEHTATRASTNSLNTRWRPRSCTGT